MLKCFEATTSPSILIVMVRSWRVEEIMMPLAIWGQDSQENLESAQ